LLPAAERWLQRLGQEGPSPMWAMAEKENISDGADYRLTQDFGASVALIARSGRLPITREEKIYPTFSTPPTTFSHGPQPVQVIDDAESGRRHGGTLGTRNHTGATRRQSTRP
jgi:hypothetical protein